MELRSSWGTNHTQVNKSGMSDIEQCMGIDEARGTLLHGMVRKGLMKDVMYEKDLN